ncbi:LOW QUALITY PROTEIN: putative RNA-directed DNA polymerase from transposon BS, partial [Frankliniella fusca]
SQCVQRVLDTIHAVLDVQVLSKEFTTSDHLPLLAQLLSFEGKIDHCNFIKVNWKKVVEELDRPYNVTNDIEYDVGHLTASIQSAILNNSRAAKRKPRKWHKNPLIKQLVIEKQQAKKTYARTRSTEDKKQLKKLKKTTRTNHQNYQGRVTSNICKLDDPILRWQVLKKNRPVPPPIPVLNTGNQVARTGSEKSEMLASTLQERFTELITPQERQISESVKRAGTAQGAVISPFLYSMYIKDMPHSNCHIKVYQYADDTGYLVGQPTTKQAVKLLNTQLKDLEKWCNNWKTKIPWCSCDRQLTV